MFFEWLNQLEYTELEIPESDVVIFLRVPPEISSANMLNRKKLDGHEQDLIYQRRVLESYESLANSADKWKIIECTINGKMRSREEIHNDIYNSIK